jgi:galactokinase
MHHVRDDVSHIEAINKKFKSLFNEMPLMVRSPGRINLIGEHTDYNEGFVLPAAVDKEIILALSPRDDDRCFLFANDLNEDYEFNLKNFQNAEPGWSNYIMGVVQQMQINSYNLKGFNCVFGGHIPIGAGLSSSAALECGVAFGINHIFNFNIEKFQIVKMSQKAENDFVGVQCGIMDQFSNMFGKSGKLIKLDCRTHDYEYIPFEFDEVDIILLDTQIKHELASSEYNERRSECAKGVELLQKHNARIRSLRDVSLDFLHQYRKEFELKIFNRCEYVIEENNRLQLGCKDLDEKNIAAFGKKMFASHEGLRHKYEVSINELDILVDMATHHEAVLGARMMGGGFGGCTINLIKREGTEIFLQAAGRNFKEQTNRSLKFYIAQICKGTSLITDT